MDTSKELKIFQFKLKVVYCLFPCLMTKYAIDLTEDDACEKWKTDHKLLNLKD